MELALLVASGGGCLDDLEMLRCDSSLRKLLGRERRSGSHACGTDARAILLYGSLTALGEVNRPLVRKVARKCSQDGDSTVSGAEKRER